MQLRECYEALGGDFDSVKERIISEDRIMRFVIKFLADSSFECLKKCIEQEDYTEAFRAAHSLKGVCYNLGFQRLGDSASNLTECLRDKDRNQIDEALCNGLFQKVLQDYEVAVEVISQLE